MLKIKQLGNSALVVEFRQQIDLKTNKKVYLLETLIKEKNVNGIKFFIPAFASLTVGFDPNQISYFVLSEFIKALAKNNIDAIEKEMNSVVVHSVPVCYDEEFAPDIKEVLKQTGLTQKEIIDLHTSVEYTILMTGFLPGFVYLGKLPSELKCKRKEVPATKVMTGSVGLAGSQTGIYPFESPGGWQIIGRTPVQTLQLTHKDQFPFHGGDKVKFVPISREEFEYGVNS
ncbi:5-oxoprolinase subunit PxpB [Marinigracilibium pacificum]|uniref:5-oxoprolinase subunit PxpB n=1 Tax=Marinigracilibium pacificum TaxID=2729599 RepID=A0A848IVA4_9BACT|nr:5-oxoprolinase subunit PxpB [Marinigracilibium pacificum]NMM47215.1 5-oxoprolinase subunit PxpB [Marinigracilibium pacificum]